MSLRPQGSPIGSLTQNVDHRIGQVYPIIEAVYEKLPHIQFLAENAHNLTGKQIEFRANSVIQAVEWRHFESQWQVLISFRELTGVDLDTLEEDVQRVLHDAQDLFQEMEGIKAEVAADKQTVLDQMALFLDVNLPQLRHTIGEAMDRMDTIEGIMTATQQAVADDRDTVLLAATRAENARRDAAAFAELLRQSWNTTPNSVKYDTPNGGALIPKGPTSDRGDGVLGKFRYNEDDDTFEGYTAEGWGPIAGAGGATGGGDDKVFYEGQNVVTTSYILQENAMCIGPLEIQEGASIEIPAGKVLVIL